MYDFIEEQYGQIRGGAPRGHRSRPNFEVPCSNRVADRARIGRRIDERVGPAELPQSVNIRIRHDRLAALSGPPNGGIVEHIDRRGVERIELNGVEQVCMRVEQAPEAASSRVERMRRDDQSLRSRLLQSFESVEAVDLCRFGSEIQKQNVLPGKGPLDARDQNDVAARRVPEELTKVELPIVQGDGQCAVSQARGTVDQLCCGVWDVIVRIVAGMSVELDFDHSGNDASPGLWEF